MSERAVGTMNVRGKPYPVKLSVFSRNGSVPNASFVIETLTIGKYGHSISHPTWEGLYKLAMSASQRASVQIDIPFMRVGWRRDAKDRARGYFRQGRIVGRHVGNDNLIFVWDGETDKRQQSIRDHEESGWYRVIQPERQREYFQLQEAAEKAREAYEDFKTRYTFEPADEIEAEIERVASNEARDDG